MNTEIQTREDVVLLVNTFYSKIKSNDLLGPIFSDIARIEWDQHLPIMYSFWSSILLEEHSYRGNPMIKHILLSQKTPMTDLHFSEWLRLFVETVDQLFIGRIAEEAKVRAANIARLMLHKIEIA